MQPTTNGGAPVRVITMLAIVAALLVGSPATRAAVAAGATAGDAAGPSAGGSASAFGHDSLVRHKCGHCHEPDEQGQLPSIEDVRTTPEEWAVIVGRMQRLYGMKIGEGEMDRLLKELCATQILTPAEQNRVAYLSLWHNSQQMEIPADKDEERLFTTCVRCHTAGKIYSYRRTAASWARLRDFHLYVIPTVVYQMREMHWIPEADAVLRYLANKLPYGTRWEQPAAKPDGAWAVFGYEPGRGSYRGEARISDAGDSEYKVSGSLDYADGTSEAFSGDATLYGGYALRTRTKNNGFDVHGAYLLSSEELRGEWHFPAPNFRTSGAVWLRASDALKVARVTPAFLLKGERTTLTIEGLNLPDASASDIRIADERVKVLAVKRLSPAALEVQVVSDADKLSTTALAVRGAGGGTITLAPRIDYIAITPAMGRARLSGGRFYPAEGVQFEAVAYARDGTGKAAAGVPLGPVPATFQLAAEPKRPNDDDLRWLGGILPNGTYLPVGDYGPNPLRNYGAENSGLVKVVARYKHGTQVLTAQARLAVTMPDFIPRLR